MKNLGNDRTERNLNELNKEESRTPQKQTSPEGTPEKPAPSVPPETPARPAKPEQPAPDSPPETPAKPSNPEEPAPSAPPETPARPAKPEQPAPDSPPETPAKPDNPEKPAPAAPPETPAKPDNPEKPAPAAPPETPAKPSSLVDDEEERKVYSAYDDSLDRDEEDEAPTEGGEDAGTPDPGGEATGTPDPEGKATGAPDQEGKATGTPDPGGEATGTPDQEGKTTGTPDPGGEATGTPDQEGEDSGTPDQDREEPAPQRVNYSLLSSEDLVKLLREKLDHPGRENFRRDVEDIRKAFFEKRDEKVEEIRGKFLEEGGDPEDFKPVEDPLEGEFKELLDKYREMKAEHSRKLEKSKQTNLEKKQEILEQFRILMEGQESFEVTFRKFKDLQRQWFGVGVVPQQNLKDLWDSYNYFVDKFNDYVRINRELRALDLKKNLDLKIQLCEKTEALDSESNVIQAFKTLQKYHARWREIGPVPREQRDEVWERFKAATSAINRKHQEHHSKLKASLHENLEKKKALCEQVEEIAAVSYTSHKDWSDRTSRVLEIQKTWKTIGYAPKKENNAIYARFRKACDLFFGNKASFYSAAYAEQKDNLDKKSKIVERAESLADSQDWKETTQELIRLQKQWKEIGPVPRRDSDKLWKRFRKACDQFFQSKSRYFEDVDSTFDDNLKAKQELVAEMEAYSPTGDQKSDMKSVEEFQKRFDAIGFVPSAKKDRIKEEFRKAQDRLLERIGLNESERSLLRFRNRIRGILNSPRSGMKLSFERDKLVNKLQQLQSDMAVWENNIGFFKESEGSEGTLQEFHEKIESGKERIALLERKIALLDDMDNEN